MVVFACLPSTAWMIHGRGRNSTWSADKTPTSLAGSHLQPVSRTGSCPELSQSWPADIAWPDKTWDARCLTAVRASSASACQTRRATVMLRVSPVPTAKEESDNEG